MQEYDKIIDNLYVGNKRVAELYNKDFDLIVNCTHDVPLPKEHNNCIRLSVKDDPAEADKLLGEIYKTKVLDTIHDHILNNKKVLVHCWGGVQRSCTVIACYLIKYNAITPHQAIEFIRQQHRIAFFGQINFIHTINMIHKANSLKK